MKRVSRKKIVDEIKNSRGQFFSMIIKKNDGTARQLMCKLNYDKLDDFIAQRVPVFDFVVNDYRSVNVSGIIAVSIGGQSYKAKK